MFYSGVQSVNVRFKPVGQVPTGVGSVLTKQRAATGEGAKVTGLETIYVSTKGGVQRLDSKLRNTPLHSDEGGHTGAVLCLAASEDGKWVVTGGQDKMIGVWDVSEGEPKWVTGMRGHKDAVTVSSSDYACLTDLQSLALPPLSNPTYHLLSASLSRHLTLHSLSTLSPLETFYGHQDSIPSVSALKPTTCVTAGSRDRTCRFWKVEEEIQLVLRAGGKTRTPEGEWVEGSVDVVCVLDDSHFVSGGDTGSIAFWSTGKKKPLFTNVLAHGSDTEGHNLLPSSAEPKPRWITALAHLRGSNIFASGSWDGEIRFWKVDHELKRFEAAGSTHVGGFINALQLLNTPNGVRLVAAVGREPRLGRWVTVKARNGVLVADVELEKE